MSTEDPMAAVHQYIDGFNKGDAKMMAATFAVPGSILDGMAPHVWQGPTATQDWYRDVLVEGEQHGASGYLVTLGEPLHNNVTGDSAYVVVPATMTFKVHGKQVTQIGAMFTVALRKLAEGWRIAAWAWSERQAIANLHRGVGDVMLSSTISNIFCSSCAREHRTIRISVLSSLSADAPGWPRSLGKCSRPRGPSSVEKDIAG